MNLRGFAILLPTLVLLAFAAGAEPDGIDPRLGPPFARRDRPSLGSADAPIVVIEFGNYGCSHCTQFHERVFPALRERYIETGQVQWFFVPGSVNATGRNHRVYALGRCAEEQGKFWDILDFLIANSHRAPSRLGDLVGRHPALDQQEFSFCMRDRETEQMVLADFDEFDLLEVKQTPTFIVRRQNPDGTRTETRFGGYQSVEYFQRVLGELRAKA